MERKERRHPTREFKLEAVRLAAVGDKTKAKVARELGVRVNQLRQWRLDFEEEERNGVPKQELASAEQDLGALRREKARLREENEILKKSGHLLCEGVEVKYAFVECQRRQHSVRTLCSALRVSPSGYYAARSRPPSARDERRSSLTAKILEVHLASRQTYGAPRVHAELSVQGIACYRNTVAKLMRRAQIVPKAIRRFRVTTDSRNTKAIFPNLVRRCFKAERPNTCWLSDVTYIPTREGWLYLAAVLDVYSRAIVGCAMSHTLGGQLATDALAMAISQRGVPELVHSDRGSTYATSIYLDLMRKHGIRQSMSRKGNCWDNAPMESFFHSLKTELVMHCDFKSRDQARASLFDYMEVFYNRQRRHSTIHYVAPLAFEASTSA